MKTRITKTLEELISIRSISREPEECRKAIDYVRNHFADTSFCLQKFEYQHVFSLIISKKKTMNFDLIFLGHLDVVPAQPSAFTPRIEDDWLYGRGAIDMKGPVAVMLELFKAHESDPAFDNFALVLTTDEELGGASGVGYLIEQQNLQAKTVFNPDGGDTFTPCISEKGVFHLELFTEGLSVHGSRPWEGANALELLLEDIERIKSAFDFATEEEQNKISFNLGRLQGGKVANLVPNLAEASIDIRFPPEMNSKEILNKITACINNSRIEVRASGEAIQISKDDPSFTLLQEELSNLGFPKKEFHANGASDARWFVPQGSSILLIKPEGKGVHQHNEAVKLESLSVLYKLMENYSQKYALSL